MCEACHYKGNERTETKVFGEKTFLPVTPVIPDDMLDIVFVNIRVLFKNRIRAAAAFGKTDDLALAVKRYLRIGDERGGKNGMGSAALRADDTADFQPERTTGGFDLSGIVAMEGETSRMAAGASYPM